MAVAVGLALAALQGDYDEAVRLSEEALAGWRQLGDQPGIARTLLCLATVARGDTAVTRHRASSARTDRLRRKRMPMGETPVLPRDGGD